MAGQGSMKAPEGMTILPVIPSNYDEIVSRSQENPFKDPYTVEDLERIRSQAQCNNSVALVMFMDPDFWRRERSEGHSCSCHARNAGACDICKELGCEVWDFNQVAMPREE